MEIHGAQNDLVVRVHRASTFVAMVRTNARAQNCQVRARGSRLSVTCRLSQKKIHFYNAHLLSACQRWRAAVHVDSLMHGK